MSRVYLGDLAPDALPRIRGQFIVKVNNGGFAAQKWPRKRPDWKSSASYHWCKRFGFAAVMAANPIAPDLEAATGLAVGTFQVPRDFLTMAATGRMWIIENPDGSEWGHVDGPFVGSAAPVYDYIVATGGQITDDGDFRVHVLKDGDVFEITGGTGDVDYLIVGGGAAGGSYFGGGGGGGGEVITGTFANMTVGSFPATVGAHGTSAPRARGTNGGDTVFNGITAIGGGGGAGYNNRTGADGANGGGGYKSSAGGAGTAAHGHAGGAGNASNYIGGGGGGWTEAGYPGTGTGGNGGHGYDSAITGTSLTYGGGGAGASNAGAGTNGGGVGGTGYAGRGGGGNGNYGNSSAQAGGDGIVILRYQFQEASP